MQDYNQLVVVMFIALAILISPLFFIGFDFWAGIRKAKERRETITSDGWKRTVTKISRYYNMLLALLVLDSMQLIGFWYLNIFHEWSAPLFPWLTLFGAFFIGAIEVKSILEPANEKERIQMKEVAILAEQIARHKTDPAELAEAIAKYLNHKNREHE